MLHANIKKGMTVKLVSLTTIPAQLKQDGTMFPLTVAVSGIVANVVGKNPARLDDQWIVETAEGLRFPVYSSQVQTA